MVKILMDMKNFSLIIPCFNEEDIIDSTLERVFTYINKHHPQMDWEIIVVNDGSTDGTASKILAYKTNDKRLRLIDFPTNRGRGAAMKAGIAAATFDYIMFLDADLSYDVHHISEVIACFEKNHKLDVIIVSPYMSGGKSKNIPCFRLMLSKMANWILAGFFSQKVSTVTSMVRAYRTKAIQNLILVENGKELHLEILKKLYLIGANIIEIPGCLIWKEKKNRNKRINTKQIALSAKKHFLYGFLSKPTRFIGKLALIVLFISIWEFFNLIRVFLTFYTPTNNWFGKDLWLGLSQTFHNSPHTVIIALSCLIISIQVLSYLALFSILNMQHEVQLQHFIELFKESKK